MEMHEMNDLAGGGQNKGASIEHHRKELLIDILEDSLEPTMDCCIYRVPKHLRKINEEAYTPQLISIGPLHHGKPELAYMEKQKTRYLREYQDRITITPDKWKELESYVRKNKQRISNCYAKILSFKNDEDFVRMVLSDSVFIIEHLLRRFHNYWKDYLVRTPWLKRAIKIDLQLLENQLPFYILQELYRIAFGVRDGGVCPVPFLTLCCNYFACSRLNYFIHSSSTSNILGGVKIKHFTDLIRYDLVKPYMKQKVEGFIENIPSAVKLHESGLKFKPIEPESLVDIEFKSRKRLIPFLKVGELHMPRFFIFDDTECSFRNIMALEQCHYPSKTHFCNYIYLLDKLINTEKDVDLLIDKGVLTCNLGDHAAAADMVNKLCKNITYSKSFFPYVTNSLKKHYNNPWNHTQAKLSSVYFCNPWRGTATVAAIILLVLTSIQTVCSIISLL